MGSTLSLPSSQIRKKQSGKFIQEQLETRLSSEQKLGCQGVNLDEPGEELEMSSGFASQSTSVEQTSFGSTYEVGGGGQEVKASHSGDVLHVGSYERQLPSGVVHPSGKTVVGWGDYLILGNDFIRTLYSNLDANRTTVQEGDSVEKGQSISSTKGIPNDLKQRPNDVLFFKNAISPRYFQEGGSIDGNQCMGRALQGEIDVGDTGPAPDDAFFVYWDGKLIGETEVGEVNHISLGNMREGEHELRLVVSHHGPDISTWGVILRDGITFSDDGSTRRDGGLGDVGTYVDLPITIPSRQCFKSEEEGEKVPCDKILVLYENIPDAKHSKNGKNEAFLDYSKRRNLPAKRVKVVVKGGGLEKTTSTDERGFVELKDFPKDVPLEVIACAETGVKEGSEDDFLIRVWGTRSGRAECSSGFAYHYSQNTTLNNEKERTIAVPSGCEEKPNGNCLVDGAYIHPRISGAFSIHDKLYTLGVDKLTKLGEKFGLNYDFPELVVDWQHDLTGASYKFDTSLSRHSILIGGDEKEDTNEFDTGVILHEFCHYFLRVNSRSDNPGGFHSAGRSSDGRVAYEEGLCNALSAVLTNKTTINDTGKLEQEKGSVLDLINPEINSGLGRGGLNKIWRGWFVENAVGAMIYDLIEDEKGLSEILKLLTSDEYKSIDALLTVFPFLRMVSSLEKVSLNPDLLVKYELENSEARGEFDDYGDHEDLTDYQRHFYRAKRERDKIYQPFNKRDDGSLGVKDSIFGQVLEIKDDNGNVERTDRANKPSSSRFYRFVPEKESYQVELTNCKKVTHFTEEFEFDVNVHFYKKGDELSPFKTVAVNAVELSCNTVKTVSGLTEGAEYSVVVELSEVFRVDEFYEYDLKLKASE